MKAEEEDERVFIFGPAPEGGHADDHSCLDELAALVESAGGEVVGRLVQVVKRQSPATFFGSGKVEELKRLVRDEKASLAVFDQELSPAQARNIENIIKCRVIDRSELIMDIFAGRASSLQAKLQVELAQLKYKLPRLKRMWTHLDRIHSAIGARGPGETQIETDRRLIRNKIRDYTAKLKEMEHRQRRRIQNRESFKVSLVGYTNAGKSTLLHSLTGADIYMADQLFATLDTTTRKLVIPGLGPPILISDTVGFVSHLPHHLVNSFHATLAETMEADLLLHVVDASNERLFEQVETVEKVLNELNCSDLPTIIVANKTDRPGAEVGLADLDNRYDDVVAISAKEKKGIPELIELLTDDVMSGWIDLDLLIPYEHGQLANTIRKLSLVRAEDAVEQGISLKLKLPRSVVERHHLESYRV